jgi:hypothetical protein
MEMQSLPEASSGHIEQRSVNASGLHTFAEQANSTQF